MTSYPCSQTSRGNYHCGQLDCYACDPEDIAWSRFVWCGREKAWTCTLGAPDLRLWDPTKEKVSLV